MPDALGQVLAHAQLLGFIGPGDPEAHRRHAEACAAACELALGGPPQACCDLGSGAGIPGLVLAGRWAHARITLLDASARRAHFLREAIGALDLGDRVRVAEGRAEHLARDPELEGTFPLVCARAFGAPAATAECATRLLTVGGVLVVAEPPEGARREARWPAAGLAKLGLGPASSVGRDPAFVAIASTGPCPAAYPRRDGLPAKRPLF